MATIAWPNAWSVAANDLAPPVATLQNDRTYRSMYEFTHLPCWIRARWRRLMLRACAVRAVRHRKQARKRRRACVLLRSEPYM